MPTLLEKGNLVPTEWSEPKSELDKIRPLDYVLARLERVFANAPDIPPGTSVADRIMILESSTGSGKSTTIPPEIFHRFFKKVDKNIVCTQPTRLTATSIPQTILPYHTREFLNKIGQFDRSPLIWGENIGFVTGPVKFAPAKGIIFATIGVLTAQLNTMSDEMFMKKYFVILIDEAHRRSIDADMAMFQLKAFIARNYMRPECPYVIIMSATFDTVKSADYFLSSVPAPGRYQNIIKVAGFSQPVTLTWAREDSPNYIEAVVNYVREIHKNNPADYVYSKWVLENPGKYGLKPGVTEKEVLEMQTIRDVLIFYSGKTDMNKTKKAIDKLNLTDPLFMKYPVAAFAVASEDVTGNTRDYVLALKTAGDKVPVYVGKDRKYATRRVIMSTNVAETGITIDTLKYVIETGWHKPSEFNPDFNMYVNVKRAVTQGMFKQRKGRAGRIYPGHCYVAYTEAVYNKMIPDEYPEIVKTNSVLTILNLMIRSTDPENRSGANLQEYLRTYDPYAQIPLNIYKLDLPDLPPVSLLQASIDTLYTLGAITGNTQVTRLGFVMNRFRFITVESIKMILAGYAYGVYIPDLIAIAVLSGKAFDAFVDGKSKFDISRTRNLAFVMRFIGGEYIENYNKVLSDLLLSDDMLGYLLVYSEIARVAITGVDKVREFCNDYGIDYDHVNLTNEQRESAIQSLASSGFNPYANPESSFAAFQNQNYDFTDKLDYIRRIKRCIYEGYKNNLAIYDSAEKKYYTARSHVELSMASHTIVCNDFKGSQAVDTNPRYFVFDEIIYRSETIDSVSVFAVYPSNISVMDGFVNVDPMW